MVEGPLCMTPGSSRRREAAVAGIEERPRAIRRLVKMDGPHSVAGGRGRRLTADIVDLDGLKVCSRHCGCVSWWGC